MTQRPPEILGFGIPTTKYETNPVLLVCGMEVGLLPAAAGRSAGSEVGTNPGI